MSISLKRGDARSFLIIIKVIACYVYSAEKRSKLLSRALEIKLHSKKLAVKMNESHLLLKQILIVPFSLLLVCQFFDTHFHIKAKKKKQKQNMREYMARISILTQHALNIKHSWDITALLPFVRTTRFLSLRISTYLMLHRWNI